MSETDPKTGINRRQFLTATGAASAAAGGVGLGLFGYAAGTDPNSYLGWQNQEGASLTINHRPYEVDQPTYERVGPTSRPDARVEQLFERRGRFRQQYTQVQEGGEWEPAMAAHYARVPEDLELDILYMTEVMPALMKDMPIYQDQFLLAEAWSNAMGAVGPRPPETPPEESDFPGPSRYEEVGEGGVSEPLKMKSPEKTAELIKKVAHMFGSTLVGITELNPDWVYGYPIRRRGFEDVNQPLEIPAHWKYAIVVGTPMSWDAMYASPNYSTSEDAYSRSRIIAARVEAFVKSLGYPARSHFPGTSYDLMVPPIAIDAGLGEQGRHSILITPEMGCNFRPAVVTTNLEMKTDKPIDIGVQDFCKHCKVCAEICPSNAITMGDKEEVRGYRRYKVNASKCNNFWMSNLGSMGCRLCVAACPYTRKANWLHKTAAKVTMNDPTGLSERALTSMQKGFYPGPEPSKYYIPSLGGENASYREPPWWLKSEDFIEFD